MERDRVEWLAPKVGELVSQYCARARSRNELRNKNLGSSELPRVDAPSKSRAQLSFSPGRLRGLPLILFMLDDIGSFCAVYLST